MSILLKRHTVHRSHCCGMCLESSDVAFAGILFRNGHVLLDLEPRGVGLVRGFRSRSPQGQEACAIDSGGSGRKLARYPESRTC